MTYEETIQKLFSHNLTVIPLNPPSPKTASEPEHGKDPVGGEGWKKRTPADNTLADFAFTPRRNVGVALGSVSGNIVDIDLDHPLALRLAPYFLPKTGWIFGRKSERTAHWIYRLDGNPGRTVRRQIKGQTIIEYRGTGGQTMFPPSVHPNGETVEFESFDEPGVSTQDELKTLVDWIWLAVGLYGSYERAKPQHGKSGSRQDIALALSGTLLNADKSQEEIRRFLNALCEITNDNEKDKRLQTVELTARKKSQNQPFTQESHLRDLIGKDALEFLLKVFPKTKSPAAVIVGDEDDKNDVGIAKLFSHYAHNRVIYVREMATFYVYNANDGVWRMDLKNNATSLILDECIACELQRLRLDAKVPPALLGKEIHFLLKYRNEGNIQNALKRAAAFTEVPLTILDSHNECLALDNGLYDFRTGLLEPLRPEHYITERSNVAYDPKADCPLFKQFLNDIFCGDEQLIRYMKALMGYFLTGNTERQEFYIFWGTGQNGKSTLLNVLNRILGSLYGSMMAATLFEQQSPTQTGYDLVTLMGKRLVNAAEGESQFKLNSSLMKQISGQDLMKVRMLYKPPFEVKPKFKLVISCNEKPIINVYDQAVKRRARFIPFNHVIPAEKRVLKYEETLLTEASGILNYLLEGAKTYMDGNINEPPTVIEATRKFFEGQDSVRNFLAEKTIQDPTASVGIGNLYQHYCDYCAEEMIHSLGKGKFGQVMANLKYQQDRDAYQRTWRGLRKAIDGESEVKNFFVERKNKMEVVA